MSAMRHLPLVVLTLLALQAPALAQTQLELNFQAKDKAMAADKVLNQRYKQVMGRLGSADRTQLTKAELAWIKFRDAECTHEEDQYRGGSMAQMIYWQTYQRLTELRAQGLEAAVGPAGAAADRKLNAIYQAWDKEQDPAAHKLLQQAELAWIAFRDAEAARFKDRAGAVARLSNERAHDLKVLLDERRSH
ncbi:MAG: hypothetical protein JWM80_5877 [Cyanobacteria bacterium RYN_339]|nr:hypothetical protein [Cyanobacteria bacterium RYN_339]